jgi:serine/threonine protein phosphatase PrpC
MCPATVSRSVDRLDGQARSHLAECQRSRSCKALIRNECSPLRKHAGAVRNRSLRLSRRRVLHIAVLRSRSPTHHVVTRRKGNRTRRERPHAPAFSFATYETAIYPLEPGDRLVLYTDGILEATNAQGEEFGSNRLCTLLADSATLRAEEAADRVISSLEAWSKSQNDDLTVLICDYSWARTA